MKKIIFIILMVLGIFGTAYAELEVYDANGQFLGMTDYWATGGDSGYIWIPSMNTMVVLYGTSKPGEAKFDRFLNYSQDGYLLSPEHPRLLYMCGKFYQSIEEYVSGFYVTDQYWYPCEGQNINPPIYSSGANFFVVEVDPTLIPFTLPIATPLKFKYIAPYVAPTRGKK